MNNDMLSAGMTANIKPGELINRDALKRAFENLASDDYNEPIWYQKTVFETIDKAPAIDISGNEYFPYRTAYFNGVEDGRATARPQGKWYYNYQNGWHCSICHESVKDMPTVMGKANFAFCPNCGADMQKGSAE